MGEIIIRILLAVLTQVLLWVGGTILVGVLVAFGNKLFYKCTGTASHSVCIMSGVIGVPLHELGHALFCVIFRHKIIEVKWFMPSAPDGVLGYVNHSYNPKNFYQRLGNFFIGVGPILLISAVITLLQFLLLPSIFALSSAIQSVLATDVGYGANVFYGLWFFLQMFFSADSFVDWHWWVYIVLSCTLCLHMNLSQADIKGSTSGLFFTILLFAAVPIISALIDIKSLSVLDTVNGAMITGGVYYLGVLIMAVICVYLLVVIAFVLSSIVRLFHRKH